MRRTIVQARLAVICVACSHDEVWGSSCKPSCTRHGENDCACWQASWPYDAERWPVSVQTFCEVEVLYVCALQTASLAPSLTTHDHCVSWIDSVLIIRLSDLHGNKLDYSKKPLQRIWVNCVGAVVWIHACIAVHLNVKGVPAVSLSGNTNTRLDKAQHSLDD